MGTPNINNNTEMINYIDDQDYFKYMIEASYNKGREDALGDLQLSEDEYVIDTPSIDNGDYDFDSFKAKIEELKRNSPRLSQCIFGMKMKIHAMDVRLLY